MRGIHHTALPVISDLPKAGIGVETIPDNIPKVKFFKYLLQKCKLNKAKLN